MKYFFLVLLSINSYQAHSQPITADCREVPLKYPDFETLAMSPNITTQQEFLDALPKGAMQTFTFNFSSKSAQGSGVSEALPGIIRMSMDGKLVIRYTCDPTKPTAEKVEVLTFDDQKNKYKMVDIDFKQPPESRITENPKLCMGCHNAQGINGVPDPKPIWQQYDAWDGFYGSEDDTFHATGAILSKSDGRAKPSPQDMDVQRTKYLGFREAQKDNPCYKSLPWPDPSQNIQDPQLYPYSETIRNGDYTRRPGLKFTEVQCHLAAKRLARRFQERPEYPYIKYALGMKAMNCDADTNEMINQIIPEVNLNESLQVNRVLVMPDPRDGQNSYSLAFRVGKAMAITDSEWTLHFKKNDDPSYRCGISNDGTFTTSGDLGIGDLLQGEIMRELASEVPKLASAFSLSRGESQGFGENFGCIDDLGGGVVIMNNDYGPNRASCNILMRKQKKLENTILAPRKARKVLDKLRLQRIKDCEEIAGEVLESELSDNMADIQKVSLEILSQSEPSGNAVRGKAIASGICMECHDPTAGYLGFFSDEESTREHLAKNPTFSEKVKNRINSKINPMPPDRDMLTDQERLDLMEYLNTFLTEVSN